MKHLLIISALLFANPFTAISEPPVPTRAQMRGQIAWNIINDYAAALPPQDRVVFLLVVFIELSNIARMRGIIQ